MSRSRAYKPKAGAASLNAAVAQSDGLFVTLEHLSDSEDSLGSLGSATTGGKAKWKGHAGGTLPKIPVHIIDRNFYRENEKQQKKERKQKGERRRAWTERGQVEELKEEAVGDEESDDNLSIDSFSTSIELPSPISPGKRFLQQKSLLLSPASPSQAPGQPSSPASLPPTVSLDGSPSKTSALPTRLRSMQQDLVNQKASLNQSARSARTKLISNADRAVSNLPLRYLLSKPELRHYAVERILMPFMRLLVLKKRLVLSLAWAIWLRPPEIKMNEKQAKFMVLADALSRLLHGVYHKTFSHWAWHYSSRRTKQTAALKNKAAEDIQRWFRHTRIIRTKSFQWLTTIIESCLQRRKAIKHFIQFEWMRRSAVFKVRRGVFRRRRTHYGARNIDRVWRWMKLYRKTQQRLTRRAFARVIQRWYRMVKMRDEKTLLIIRKILQHGGYSVVLPKAKRVTSMGKSHYDRVGFLGTIEQCASQIQRAWYKSKGQFALFMLFAARRARMEYEKMLNENATIIQQNFRGHLWNLLCKAAMQWNRSRRISRGFRAFKFRCWNWHQMQVIRRNRMARRIQALVRRFLFTARLRMRFKLRKALLIFTRAKKTIAAMMIQREYRAHLERERIKHEQLVAFIAQQRAQAQLVAKKISLIQRNFRQFVTKTFPTHVKMVMWRLLSERRAKLLLAAVTIQKCARPWVVRILKKRRRLHKKMANRIWRFAKARMLAQALWDRVEARRLKEKRASICMQRNFRSFLFIGLLKTRDVVRLALREHRRLVYNHATYVQRWMLRKTMEYYLPVRVAARRQLKKRREAELLRRKLKLQNKAAGFITRLLRLFPVWNKNLKRFNVDRVYYFRRKAAKRMQRFARMVIAWGRFNRIVAYRKAAVREEEVRALMAVAANVVGHYWKRYQEKKTLQVRFENRRKMLDEWHRLEELRLKAMKERAWALEEKRRTDENMAATIKAAWKQGSDTAGKNYYYNFVTGESSWTAPDGWKVPHAVDKWIRQLDERQNVYYYNMQTQESSWLPPCGMCGQESERHCEDCSMAYCEQCFESRHTGEDQEEESDANHKWSLVEFEKQKLGPGDVYCIECKKRTAMRMCLTCWDPYCNECFQYTHHVGDLKYHKTMAYKKVKAGWMTIKSKDVEGDDGEIKMGDYYMNGITGETTYEKPAELFTPQEKLFYDNFQNFKKAHEESLKKIEDLQYQLEEASYERDSILQENLKRGDITSSVQNVLKKRKKKKGEAAEKAALKDVIEEVAKKNVPGPMSWLLGDTTEYRAKMLSPNPRQRGAQRAGFLSKLIEEGEAIAGGGKKKNNNK